MKNILLSLCLFATLAHADLRDRIELYCYTNGIASVRFPDEVTLQDNGSGPYIAQWNVAGLAKPTLAQLPDDATAMAWQAARTALPTTFPNGLAVQNEQGHWLELVPVEANVPVLAVQVSNSPLTPEVREALKAAAIAAYQQEWAAQAAALAELNLTAAQITAIKAYFTANVDTLFPSMTVNQRNFLKVQQALLRALVKQEIKEVR